MIHISDNLKNVLEEFRTSSRVADLLLSGNYTPSELQDSPPDYLDISESDSTKISYLSQERLIGVDSNTQNMWTCNRRYHARPGSVMNKVFSGISGRDIEIFNNVYKSALTKVRFKFKIASGIEIKDYYIGDRYHTHSGSLGASCMKYEGCQRYFGMYMDNPEIISMLAMVDDRDTLMGRAILWNFDSYKVMDRIYTINDEELSYQFKKWAADNGYMYKHEQKWNNSLSFELGGKKMEQKFCVQLKNWKYDRYPYMDTFKFLDREEGKVYNYIPHDGVKTLCAPDGGQFSHDHLVLDSFTGLHHYHGEMVQIKYLDGKIVSDTTLRSHSSNVEWSRVNDIYIFRKDVKYSEEIDDYIFKDELDYLNNNAKIEAYKAKILEERKMREKEKKDNIRHLFDSAVREGQSISELYGHSGNGNIRRTRRVEVADIRIAPDRQDIQPIDTRGTLGNVETTNINPYSWRSMMDYTRANTLAAESIGDRYSSPLPYGPVSQSDIPERVSESQTDSAEDYFRQSLLRQLGVPRSAMNPADETIEISENSADQ